MQRSLRLLFVLFMASALLTTSCRKDSDNPVESGSNQSTITTTIIGVVSDESGQGMSGVAVSAHGRTATTNEHGLFVMKDVRVPQNRCFVLATNGGYFTGSRAEKPKEGGVTHMRLSLMRNTAGYSIHSLTGGTVELTEGGSVVLPADNYVTSSGQPYDGAVKVAARWLNPTSSDFFDFFPGDFAATRSNGSTTELHSYGVLNVELMSQTGEKLQLGLGKKATLKYPIPPSMLANAPNEMPLWYFDEAIGMWKEDGKAVKQGSFYVGEVSHFTPWNCDIPINPCTITGRVVCNGGPVADVVVTVGQRLVITNEDGYFSCPAPPDFTISVSVLAPINRGLHTDEPILVGPMAPGGTTTIEVPVGPCPSYLTGTLVDCNGQPTLGIVQAKSGSSYSYSTTKDGQFKIRVEADVPINVDALSYESGSSDLKTVSPVSSCHVQEIGQFTMCSQTTISFMDIVPDMNVGVTAALSPDGRMLAVSDYLTIKVFNTQSGALITSMQADKPGCTNLSFSADASMLLTASGSSFITVDDGSVSVVDTKTWQKIRSFKGTSSAAFTPDAKSILLTEYPSRNIVRYNISTGAEIGRFDVMSLPTMYGPLLLGTRSNGRQVVYQTYNYETFASHIVVWDMVSKVTTIEFAVNLKNYPGHVSLSADGMRMLEEEELGDLNFYNVSTGGIFNSVEAEKDKNTYRSSLISPAGTQYVMQLIQKGMVMPPAIFNIDNGAVVHMLPVPAVHMFTKFVYNGNGKALVGLYDKDAKMGIRIWQLP